MKAHHIIIPLATVATAVTGSYLTSIGLAAWYGTLELPPWTPPGGTIGIVWTAIFTLSMVSALILWYGADPKRKALLAAAFLLNAGLNVLWSWLFFVQHRILAAGFEALLLEASVLALIALAWPVSRLAASLLAPYAAWVAFATYLTFTIEKMNR